MSWCTWGEGPCVEVKAGGGRWRKNAGVRKDGLLVVIPTPVDTGWLKDTVSRTENQNALPGCSVPEKASELSDAPSLVQEVGRGLSWIPPVSRSAVYGEPCAPP